MILSAELMLFLETLARSGKTSGDLDRLGFCPESLEMGTFSGVYAAWDIRVDGDRTGGQGSGSG